jgi:tetratricopeptide (TPR) repeat protein/CHAT domain-containing protein
MKTWLQITVALSGIWLLTAHFGMSAFADDVTEADALQRQSVELFRAGRPKEALPLAEKLVQLREKVNGPEHPAIVTGLYVLALIYQTMGEHAKAEPLFQRTLRISEATLGPEHPGISPSLMALASLYQAVGDYAKAEPLFQRALRIYEAKLSPDDPNTATGLNSLASLYIAMGDYAKAEPLFQRALKIMEVKLGPEHPDTANSLLNLAAVFQEKGDYAKAEPLFQRALKIREAQLGAEHPGTAACRSSLALLYQAMGDYGKAESLIQGALRTCETKYGPEHPTTAKNLESLASLYKDMGDQAKAEPLLQRALKIMEVKLGPEHPDTAKCVNSLAGFYRDIGDHAKAEPLLQRVLRICEDKLGPEHPNTAVTLNNLATLYTDMGEYAKAEPLLQRAMKISERVLGPQHAALAIRFNNLAAIYQAIGDNAKAEPLCQRALEISETRLGPEHPQTADSLSTLGVLYQNMGENRKAEPLFQRALKIREAQLGAEHPRTAASLSNLAVVLVANGQPDQSLTYNEKCWAIREKQREQIFSFASERQQAAFVQALHDSVYVCVSLAANQLQNNSAARRLALTMVLSSKGAILESLARRQASIVGSGNPELIHLRDRYRMTRGMLSKAMMTSAKPGQLVAHLARLSELEKQKEAAEEALARASAPFAAERQSRRIAVADVTRALPPGSALVEFVKYRPFRFDAKSRQQQWGDWNYAALVLRSGEKPDAPDVALLPLGPADKVETAVRYWRSVFDVTLYRSPAVRLPVFEPASKDLAALVWKPIISALGNCRKVYISPDGELAFVNFGALPGQKPDRFLIEDFDISYVTTGRDLLRLGAGQGNPPLLVGAPDYGMQSSRKGGFSPLPGTLAEVNAIAPLLKQRGENPTLLTGAQAAEAAVKAAKHPRILHLATHGFFLPDVAWDWLTTRNGVSGFGGDEFDPAGSARLWLQIKKENPMRRSGIALAHANDTLAGRREPGDDDGILTAEEVIGMDLWGTQLVVISACESGLGESRGGEGVFGLRRAFALAGAQNLVMTLWPVADEPTMMECFYRHLQTGGTPQRALLAAQREWIAKERSGGREPHPFFWAAFVASGTGFGLEEKAK